MTVDQAWQKAIDAHKAGHIQDADRLYRSILQAQPKHPGANHNIGQLAVGIGKVQEALPFLKTALEANQSIAQFWISYIDALIKLDRLVDAKSILAQAGAKGVKGDGFNRLEQSLNASIDTPTEAGSDSNGEEQGPSNILDTLTLDQATKLARKKSKEGAFEEAKRVYQDILARFPKNKKAIDGTKLLSSQAMGKASKGQDPPQDQLQPLISLYSQGQLQQTVEQASQLLQQFPSSIFLHNICGAASAGLGQYDSAIESYKQALKIKPDLAEVYSNMGSALEDKGDLEAALGSYKQALKIKPDFAEGYYNIGNVQRDRGDLKAAIVNYKQALKINPNFAEACYNMGVALRSVEFTKPDPDLQKIIFSLIDNGTHVRPSDISKAAISLLKFEPLLVKAFEKNSAGELVQSLQETISNLSDLPLLLKLMSVCPIDDIELESLLRNIRSFLLSTASEITGTPGVLRFQSALALQCFTNEYIYSQTDKEANALAELESAIDECFSKGRQPSPQTVLCSASYKALREYEWCDLLTVITDIEEVFTRQILEPKEEVRLKSDIPTLQEVTDRVSSKVREQYEASPYPRWVDLGRPSKPETISKYFKALNLRLYSNAIIDAASPNILIAGCGTGQHSIESASRLNNSKVLAVDLSLSSLAYAKRKTEELDVQNIEFMQADILDLGKLDRQFDIIESSGVLHHMDNPMAGWRVLTNCLNPGGLMKIGLYSELARQHIVEMRDEIDQLGLEPNNDLLRSFRGTVINSGKGHHKRILQSHDFYSLSALRDLLFHVQEQRFSLPQIKTCLNELGLKFCGFEKGGIVTNFKLMNTGVDDLYDLDKWHSYEEANPHSFASMYQFWCQKAV